MYQQLKPEKKKTRSGDNSQPSHERGSGTERAQNSGAKEKKIQGGVTQLSKKLQGNNNEIKTKKSI